LFEIMVEGFLRVTRNACLISSSEEKTDGARGLGLGLAICRAIVHGHEGTIAAETAPDGGAVIRFELPIGGAPPEVGELPESSLA